MEPQTLNAWVFDAGAVPDGGSTDEAAGAMVNRKVTIAPGLIKIFDEILVNALDNKQRDDTMDKLAVSIDKADGCVAVWNNGRGIPAEMHTEYGVLAPELIFGYLLTSSNYDDDEKKGYAICVGVIFRRKRLLRMCVTRSSAFVWHVLWAVTGGRNGYGAKLTNIFSTKFIVETCHEKRLFRQEYRDNMSVKDEPILSPYDASDFTRITFYPDFKRFRMEAMDDDCVAMMTKRVYDSAGVFDKTLKVFLDGHRVSVCGLKQYAALYKVGRPHPPLCACSAAPSFQATHLFCVSVSHRCRHQRRLPGARPLFQRRWWHTSALTAVGKWDWA